MHFYQLKPTTMSYRIVSLSCALPVHVFLDPESPKQPICSLSPQPCRSYHFITWLSPPLYPRPRVPSLPYATYIPDPNTVISSLHIRAGLPRPHSITLLWKNCIFRLAHHCFLVSQCQLMITNFRRRSMQPDKHIACPGPCVLHTSSGYFFFPQSPTDSLGGPV